MTKLLQFSIILGFLGSSCMNVPIHLRLSEPLKIDKETVGQFEQALRKHFQEFDVSPSGANAALKAACTEGYDEWLDARFKEGLLPATTVLSAEYMGARPQKNQCRSVDVPKLYQEAMATANIAKYIASRKFSFDKFLRELEKYKCADAFLDPKRQKVTIKSIEMKVTANTMTMELPKLALYTTDVPLTDSDEARIGELIADKTLSLLGTTDAVPPKEKGKKSVKLNSEVQVLRTATDNLIPLTGRIVVVPEEIDVNPKPISFMGRSYFEIPKGELMAVFIIKTDMLFNLSDGKCARDQLYEEMEKSNK